MTLSPELMELLAELGRSIVKKPKNIDEGFYKRESWNFDFRWVAGLSRLTLKCSVQYCTLPKISKDMSLIS